MKNIKLIFALLLTTCSFALSAQEMTVKGKVTDASTGEPVPFASISLKGAMKGWSADADGCYSAVVSSDAVLVFSSIGYNTVETPVAGRGVLDVKIVPDTQLLEETVVVAFGTSTKEAFTGSATVVKSSDISKVQASDATRALEGLVAGVQMTTSTGTLGASPSIIIRGIGSMNASSSPLYVVDGVPYAGDLNNINPSDIESMTVQKDAASSSLYGARGANGVIMITTKKAKGSEAVINVDAKWGLNTRAMKTYDVFTDAGEYYEAVYGAMALYGMEKYGMTNEYQINSYANTQLADGLRYIVYSVPDGEMLVGLDGRLNPAATLGAAQLSPKDGKTYWLSPDNWLDAAYRNSLRQEYNVSASGTTERMSMFASFGYLNNKGIVGGSDMYRYTGRIRADFQAKSWLRLGANLSYTNFNWNNGNADEGSASSSANVFAVASAIAPIYPLYARDADGNIIYDERNRKVYDYGFYENGAYRPCFTQANPVSDMYLNTNNTEGNAFNVLGYAEASFLKNFKFTFNVGVNVDETRTTSVYNKFYGQFATSGGVIEKGHSRIFDINLQQLLSWNRSFGLHRVDVLLGHEWQKSSSTGLGASKSQMSDPDKDELNSAVIDNKTSYSASEFYNVEGYFLRAQYDFAEKIFLNGSYRLDASSNFRPGNWWGHFWSVGAGWLINREAWFTPAWVDMLKLKASVGSQGNDGIGADRYRKNWALLNYGGIDGSNPESLGNPDITWETNTNLNIGVDYELFSGRLRGSLEYFYRLTSDMLYFFSYPMSTGYGGLYDNVGDMHNTGVELAVNGTLMKRKNFNWDAYLNFTHYSNRVLNIPEKNRTTEIDGHKGFISGSKYVGEGLPLNTFYLKKFAGVEDETGLSQWYYDETDAAGNVVKTSVTTDYNRASYYLCGDVTPDLYGGFGTSLSFHGVDVALSFTYQIGGLAYDNGYASFMASPTSTSMGTNFHKDMLKAWTLDNKTSEIPRMQFGDTYTAASSDRFLLDASYLNFQNVQVGYTIPRRLTERMHINRLRVYLACDNVWYVSRRQGFDPRFNFSGTTNYAVNAPVRTLSGGINLIF